MIRFLSLSESSQPTLTGDRAVECISLDHETLPSRFSVRFEHIDRFHRVLLFSSRIDRFHSQHGIHSQRCKEIVIAVSYEQ